MSHFYQYDTRGASAASQIINLERMVEERDAEIGRLRDALDSQIRISNTANAEIERLRDELETFRLGKHHQENEQLRAHLESWKISYHDRDTECRREIERLREAISERDEELRSLHLIIANKDARFQRVREALGE